MLHAIRILEEGFNVEAKLREESKTPVVLKVVLEDSYKSSLAIKTLKILRV